MTLSQLFHDFQMFESSAVERVLAFLITAGGFSTAKEIADGISLPDSKIYPALKFIEEKNLIGRDSTVRPNKFYFKDPYEVEKLLNSELQTRIERMKHIAEEIMKNVEIAWRPQERKLDNIAHIFHDQEIPKEIWRILKLVDNDVFVLLSSNMKKNQLLKILDKVVDIANKGRKIDIALPPQKVDESKINEMNTYENIRIRESIWTGNSYIVRDKTIMLNIMHNAVGEVAILTNDRLLVRNILDCWKDQNCCVQKKHYELEFKISK